MSAELFCRVPANWLTEPSLCLFEWQTLLSGALAIGAAGAGAILLYSQIKQADRHESERRERRFAAARATLPLALSEITSFARIMVEVLAALRTRVINPTALPEAFVSPTVSDELIKNLQGFIEAAHDFTIVDHVCEIIREIQVLTARVESLQNDASLIGQEANIDEYIVQAARLHVIAGNLFDFARGSETNPPSSISWAELSRYLSVQHHIYEDRFPGVYVVLQRRAKAWASVWPPIRHLVDQQ